MDRRTFSIAALAATAWAGASPGRAFAQNRDLLVAEPGHSLGYLPLYAGIANGFFRDEGLAVKVITVESGAGHTNLVLTGQAFAFIGGPEHNAYAKAKGAELRAVVNCVNRGNVYFTARTGLAPQGRQFDALLRGKRIATGYYGGTPHSITRYLLAQWKLDARRDVTLIESTYGGIMAAVKTSNADAAVIPEPILTQGIRQGIWQEPFFSIPQELGDYAYSCINVRKDSIDRDPAQVAGFVRAMVKSLRYVRENREGALAVARKEFPTMAAEDLTATLQRAYADQLWSSDGRISATALDTCLRVVRSADLLKTEVAYGDIVDMRFL